MQLGGRVLAIFLVLAGFLTLTVTLAVTQTPDPAEAAQNCTLTEPGEVYCWGPSHPIRVEVTGRVVQLAASGESTCALTEPGEVYCWGVDEASGEPSGTGHSLLVLITIGLLLVVGGVLLVKLGCSPKTQGARSSVASRNWPAPALSRSV
jgi:hypothetical protein